MYDWLVIGGGIHGTYISNHLQKVAGFDAPKILVVDPHEKPLAVWDRCTSSTRMKYLRSPSEHNLDVGTSALKRYARAWSAENFKDQYDRPSLNLFNNHCRHVIAAEALADMRLKASALSIHPSANSYIIGTTSGAIESSRVIVSVGNADHLHYPEWTKALPEKAPLVHVFAPDSQSILNENRQQVVIVGAGISGAQLALALADQGDKNITLVHSKPLTKRRFDADPCWLEQRCLNQLRRKKNYNDRRKLVDAARHSGSLPDDVHRHLILATNDNLLKCREGIIVEATFDGAYIHLRFDDGTTQAADLVVLATGFQRGMHNSAFLQTAIENLQLRHTSCRSPILDEYLRWHRGLFVTGSLAELVVGPASRNIIGAKMAAQRISAAVLPKRHRFKEESYFYFQRRRA
ncbi:MAG: hypothetical protein EKK48_29495 [Candidatus Melainabacteria bacterium]|nr:MAG: hypothetical protein EKK48_29495 [Candidatus Melainabacteria bacterium]